ncbi:MAG TPA: hypothetical protein VMA09_03745 [Candidatus Binataceae bacterium]|nr:hypothetical protein [Candidatus Binataceae bacterium]
MHKSLVVAAFAAIGLGCSGCPALMIPGLAYQGYKYEEKGTPEAQSTQPDNNQKKSSQQQVPDSSIE